MYAFQMHCLLLKEFLLDYADDELKEIGERTIQKELAQIPKESARNAAREALKRLENGERDLRF